MKTPPWIRRVALPAIILAAAVPVRGNDAPKFHALFNGTDLSGWRGGADYDHRKFLSLSAGEREALLQEWNSKLTGRKAGRPHWRVEHGELVNDGGGSYATTERDYGDFELELEYRLSRGADTGICLRGTPEVQIWDGTQADSNGRDGANGSGGLWRNQAEGKYPPTRADRPIGEWNRLRILMVGSRVSVWLNGVQTVNHAILENAWHQRDVPEAKRLPVPARGPIQLQTRAGETHWRNLRIREIAPAEAIALLARAHRDPAWRIFNGRNLDGWAGALDAAAVEAGVLTWKAGGRGALYWNRELDDFRASLEFRLPPAGNNGLAIRYPGHGTPAYSGMCELQIIDENYDVVKAKLDPRQVHGSAYGMVGAARGYQHPIGEWNFQVVTVRGSRVTVELNGTVILNTDLAAVDLSQLMRKMARPQVHRTRGYFGFAGHDDPVAFREIYVQPL